MNYQSIYYDDLPTSYCSDTQNKRTKYRIIWDMITKVLVTMVTQD